LLYVRPFYAQGKGSGSFPQFQFVAVYTQDFGQAVCAQNVNDALNQMFGPADSRSASCNISITGAPPGGTSTTTTTTPTGTSSPGASTSTTLPPVSGSVQELLNQAAAKFAQADDALAEGDLGRYQALEREGRQLVSQAAARAGDQ
jgi:uncharacterized membrane protein (UPF0182 family)